MEAEGRAKQGTMSEQVGGSLDAALDTEKRGEMAEHGLRVWGLEKTEADAAPDGGRARSRGASLAEDMPDVGTRGNLM